MDIDWVPCPVSSVRYAGWIRGLPGLSQHAPMGGVQHMSAAMGASSQPGARRRQGAVVYPSPRG